MNTLATAHDLLTFLGAIGFGVLALFVLLVLSVLWDEFGSPRVGRLIAGGAVMAFFLVICWLIYTAPADAMNPVRKDYDGSSPQLEEWIAATWPVELVDEAINVAWCESRGKPTARNGQYRGILQIGRREWAKFGKGDPFDPYANSAAAYRYWSYVERTSPGKGWLRWECRP